MIAEIIGYIGVVVGTSLMLPQVIRILKTRKVLDLSLGMTLLYFFNCLLWLVYGVLISATPIIVGNAIALIISITLIALKLKYDKQ